MFGAIFLGGVIGLERQWQQRMMGAQNDGLVAVGSAMFIMMGLRGSRRYRHFLGAAAVDAEDASFTTSEEVVRAS
jgi:uncharacterized membrane protein YhiD involved in acid resistance